MRSSSGWICGIDSAEIFCNVGTAIPHREILEQKLGKTRKISDVFLQKKEITGIIERTQCEYVSCEFFLSDFARY
jgi:hypothetical protein